MNFHMYWKPTVAKVVDYYVRTYRSKNTNYIVLGSCVAVYDFTFETISD